MFISAAQIVILIAAFVLLQEMWQIFRSLPENKPIGEANTRRITHRLEALAILAVIEFVLTLIQIFRR